MPDFYRDDEPLFAGFDAGEFTLTVEGSGRRSRAETEAIARVSARIAERAEEMRAGVGLGLPLQEVADWFNEAGFDVTLAEKAEGEVGKAAMTVKWRGV